MLHLSRMKLEQVGQVKCGISTHACYSFMVTYTFKDHAITSFQCILFQHCPFSFQTLNNINTGSIRQRLKNTKDHGNKQRQSPVPANHLALSMTAPAVLIRSAAIGIPAHIPKMPRHQRNSVEGLNQVSTVWTQIMSHFFVRPCPEVTKLFMLSSA